MPGPFRPLLMATIYVTESGRTAATTTIISQLQFLVDQACKKPSSSSSPPFPLLHLATFCDERYNRTSFCVGGEPKLVKKVIVDVASAAIGGRRSPLLSCETTEHPRVGAVDHISVFPLAPTSTTEDAGVVAREIGKELAENNRTLPVFLYGSAVPVSASSSWTSSSSSSSDKLRPRRLRDVRRALGYFITGSASRPAAVDGVDPLAWIQGGPSNPLPLAPDFGPSFADPYLGVCCVGAVDPVLNYNIQIKVKEDELPFVDALAKCRGIAASISERTDIKGLKAVEALALPYDIGKGIIEIACNLLDTAKTPPEAVLARVVEEVTALGTAGMTVSHHYQIGVTAQKALKLLLEG